MPGPFPAALWQIRPRCWRRRGLTRHHPSWWHKREMPNSQSLGCFNFWVPAGGTVSGGLGVVLLEETCPWGQVLRVSSLPSLLLCLWFKTCDLSFLVLRPCLRLALTVLQQVRLLPFWNHKPSVSCFGGGGVLSQHPGPHTCSSHWVTSQLQPDCWNRSLCWFYETVLIHFFFFPSSFFSNFWF